MVNRGRNIILLVLVVFSLIGCNLENEQKVDYLRIDDFHINGNKIYGDSSYLKEKYGEPDSVVNRKNQVFWNYDTDNYFLSFENKDSIFELSVVYVKNAVDGIFEVNGVIMKTDDFSSSRFKELFIDCSFGFNVPSNEYTPIRFRSDRESMRPVIYFEKKSLKEIVF